MTLYELISKNIYMIVLLVFGCFYFIGFLWNRFWRHFNIRKHGYPPSHCDADGDFKEE